MNRKITSVLAVMMMVFASVIVLAPVTSDAASTAPTTVHPVPGDRSPWVSKDSVPYYNNLNLYYSEDPYDELIKFANGEVSLDYMKTVCGYSSSAPMGGSYYNIHYSSGNSTFSCSENYNRDVSKGGPPSQWFTGQLYFTENPYSEVVKYVNGEIDLAQLMTRCGYTDENARTGDYSKYYCVYDTGSFIHVSRNSNRSVDAGRYSMNGEAYFTEDPYDEVVKYVIGEMDLDTLKTKCGYTIRSSLVEGTNYYVVSISGNNNNYWESDISKFVRYIDVQPDYLFLDKGNYHIEIIDTDLTYVNVSGLNSSSRYDGIDIQDRKGSDNFTVSSPDAIWLTESYGGGGGTGTLENTWREKSITFTLDPAPTSWEKVTDYDKTVKVLPDREWVKKTTVDTLTGTFTNSSNDEIMFISGSDEERDFVRNVIDKGLIDASGYGERILNPNGEKIVSYTCRETSNDVYNYIYLMTESAEKGYSYSERYECESEKLSVSDVEPYKFYAKYDFSIAVKYDTSKVKAIVMMYPNGLGSTEYAVLQSERQYDFHMLCAAEYELYAIPVSTTDGTLHPVDIDIHTENVASPDSNGVIFACIAIFLCVLAFGILFLASRRPKWNELTGLPSEDTEIVQNEVPKEPPEN